MIDPAYASAVSVIQHLSRPQQSKMQKRCFEAQFLPHQQHYFCCCVDGAWRVILSIIRRPHAWGSKHRANYDKVHHQRGCARGQVLHAHHPRQDTSVIYSNRARDLRIHFNYGRM